jgi:hypothetical protein
MAHKSDNSALNSICERINTVFLNNKLAIPVTFVAGTTGSVATHSLVTVTGAVAMSLFAVCSVDVAGAGTIEVGTALATAGMIAQTTGTDIDVGDIWHDASPDSSIELTSVITQKIVTQNVGYKIASATLTGGSVTFYIGWAPISPDGRVELA